MSQSSLSDLAVYQRLVTLSEELDGLAALCSSMVSEAAVQTAATTLRGMASAIYEHALNESGGPV